MKKMRLRIPITSDRYQDKILKDTEGINKAQFFRDVVDEALKLPVGEIVENLSKKNDLNIAFNLDEEKFRSLRAVAKAAGVPMTKVLEYVIMKEKE